MVENYSKEHLERLARHTELPNSEDTILGKAISLCTTIIDISGKACEVEVIRNDEGHIEVIPTKEGIFDKGGWLSQGTCTEGYGDAVVISQYGRVD